MLRILRALVALALLISPVIAGDFTMPGERVQQRHMIPPSRDSVGVLVVTGGANTRPSTVAPGTSGNVLTSNGAIWQSTALPKETLLATVTTSSGSTANASGLTLTGYSMVRIELDGITDTSAGDTISINVSSDGGSTFDTARAVCSSSTTVTCYGQSFLTGVGATANKILSGTYWTSTNTTTAVGGAFTTKTSATNYIRFSTASTFTAGTIRIYGML